jgi:regulator of chromosome condensation
MADASQPTSLKRSRSNENAHTAKREKHAGMNQIVKAPTAVGKVFVFGTGDTGQLGLGEDMLERKRPMPLKALDGEEIVDVVCGGMHSIALTKSGKVSLYIIVLD